MRDFCRLPQGGFGAEKRYYEPTDQGVEGKIKERLDQCRQLKSQSKTKEPK